ncbi:MAG TPA: antibiotic biosynthesis monooxygenase [Nitrolancea sp.]|nr:antibiotic biosynthesis monooxygenase [Nitrolancea sp.]
MYGTVARLQLKPGVEGEFFELSREFEAANVPGYVGEYVYRMDADPSVFYLAVVFESKEAYVSNANSPEQNARYVKYRELLVSDPEWHDGEVVYTYPHT